MRHAGDLVSGAGLKAESESPEHVAALDLDLDVAALLLRRDDLGALHDVADDPHIAAPTIFERHR